MRSSPAEALSFDPIWDEIYRRGHANRYPWDCVVSFVFRHAPSGRPRSEVRILEVGCGAGNNLWFAAREGFAVAGVDASAAAVDAARRRFAAEGLGGVFEIADFTALPMADDEFDLVIDRAAITCSGYGAARRAIAEVRRVLRPSGCFLFNPYADDHGGRVLGRPGPDGVIAEIAGGALCGAGQIAFYSEELLRAAFGEGWRLLALEHVRTEDKLKGLDGVQSEWRAIAEKCR